MQNGAAGLIARASQHFSSDALVRPQSRIEERVKRPWSAFDVVTLAPTLAMPLFVIHDRGDAEIPWQHGMAITRAWRGADLLMTEGLGHRAHLIIPCSDQATLVPWPFGGTVGRPIASRWWPARRLETPPARRASQRQAVEALDDG